MDCVDSFAGFLILLGTGNVLANIRGQLDLIFCPRSLSITNALSLRPRDAYWNECRYYVEVYYLIRKSLSSSMWRLTIHVLCYDVHKVVAEIKEFIMGKWDREIENELPNPLP